MIDNKAEIQDVEPPKYVDSVIIPNSKGNDNGSYDIKVMNLEQILQIEEVGITFTMPPHKIGDTLVIDHIDFSNEIEKNNYYDNLIVDKDFLGTVTTVKNLYDTDMIIHHEYYMSVSIDKNNDSIEFGIDNSIVVLALLTIVFICKNIIFKKKK